MSTKQTMTEAMLSLIPSDAVTEVKTTKKAIDSLNKKIDESSTKIKKHEANLKNLDVELNQIINTGGDPASIIVKIRTCHNDIDDLIKLKEATEAAINEKRDELTQKQKHLVDKFMQAVRQQRSIVVEDLQKRADAIENEIILWGDSVLLAAHAVDILPPSRPPGIVLKNLPSLRDALI